MLKCIVARRPAEKIRCISNSVTRSAFGFGVAPLACRKKSQPIKESSHSMLTYVLQLGVSNSQALFQLTKLNWLKKEKSFIQFCIHSDCLSKQ